jgi:translation initiation factor 2B subunit (eIF-2B alpha/beta/delta family)
MLRTTGMKAMATETFAVLEKMAGSSELDQDEKDELVRRIAEARTVVQQWRKQDFSREAILRNYRTLIRAEELLWQLNKLGLDTALTLATRRKRRAGSE